MPDCLNFFTLFLLVLPISVCVFFVVFVKTMRNESRVELRRHVKIFLFAAACYWGLVSLLPENGLFLCASPFRIIEMAASGKYEMLFIALSAHTFDLVAAWCVCAKDKGNAVLSAVCWFASRLFLALGAFQSAQWG